MLVYVGLLHQREVILDVNQFRITETWISPRYKLQCQINVLLKCHWFSNVASGSSWFMSNSESLCCLSPKIRAVSRNKVDIRLAICDFQQFQLTNTHTRSIFSPLARLSANPHHKHIQKYFQIAVSSGNQGYSEYALFNVIRFLMARRTIRLADQYLMPEIRQ